MRFLLSPKVKINAKNFCLFFLLLSIIVWSEEAAFVPNYALSNYFGTGFYAGGDIAMINLPLSIDFLPFQKNYSAKLRLPVSFGFYHLDQDIDSFSVPKDINVVTAAIGFEFSYLKRGFILTPFADVGLSYNLNQVGEAFVFASGFSILKPYSWDEYQQNIMLKVQRASYHQNENHLSDGFFSLETGIDWQLKEMGKFIFSFVKPSFYSKFYWYLLNNLKQSSMKKRFGLSENAQEFGFTLKLLKPIDCKLFNFERIGFGFRYSKGVKTLRIVFGNPLE